jgi:xanthine dehydrogenase accessory factor
MHQLIPMVRQSLERDTSVALVTIIAQSGSTPRSRGAAMLITPEGRQQGSIGGGPAEASAQRAAAEALARRTPRLLSVDLSNAEASEAGMVCGGKLELLIDVIVPLEEELELFAALDRSLQESQPCTLVRTIIGPKPDIERIERCLINHRGLICGRFSLSRDMLDHLLTIGLSASEPTVFQLDTGRLLIEPLQTAERLFLFGAGHIGKAVADLARGLDFRLMVFDDREAFANRQRFPEAEDIRVVEGFEQAVAGLELDLRSFVLIVTRGHRYDQSVLAQVLGTRAGYIGMIGSRRKREAIYGALRSKGFTEADLRRVHCPVGLDIGAETPEEIAISIAAELIAVRRKARP